LPWVYRILAAMEEGRGRPADLDLLSAHTGLLGFGHTFCALAPGAMDPLSSALKYFRADFERHIHRGRCPWKEEPSALSYQLSAQG
jgi:NADH-quinone oxidoreductase subunit F